MGDFNPLIRKTQYPPDSIRTPAIRQANPPGGKMV
jgi:hypothetical protein